MVSFDNENDKNNLNMMRARVKIIDFGFAINLKGNLAFSALGSPINMDPVILQKFSKKNNRQLGYDEKADIWSLGTVCYEMLIGQSVFNADTMNELVKKVENGSYSVPTSVSKEVVSFLNGMLQYDGNCRLSAAELAKTPFLTKRVSDFTKIDTRRVSRKINNKGLNINVKKNQTIWAIFNEEDEKKLVNIRGGRDLPVPEDTFVTNKRRKTDTNIPRNIKINQQQFNNPMNNYQRSASINQNPFGLNPMGNSFYGQNMHPSAPMQQLPGMQPPMPQMGGMPFNSPMMNFPTFGVPMSIPYGGGMGGMYPQPNLPGIQPNFPAPGYIPPNISNISNRPPPGYAPLNNDDDDRGGDCIII
jgi:serine/threonine protein kinase